MNYIKTVREEGNKWSVVLEGQNGYAFTPCDYDTFLTNIYKGIYEDKWRFNPNLDIRAKGREYNYLRIRSAYMYALWDLVGIEEFHRSFHHNLRVVLEENECDFLWSCFVIEKVSTEILVYRMVV